jgi:hypothetical protein
VAIAANTVYVASYFAPNGHYAADNGFFDGAADDPPLHAPAGGNGVYAYAAAPAFPTSTYQSTQYWVDVVFNPSGPDTTPPTVSATTPAGGATGVATTVKPAATFSEAMDASTLGSATVELRNTATGAQVSAAISYNAATDTVTLAPAAALAPATSYTVSIRGGATDPRAKDLAGNALAATASWSFTTAAASPCPCTAWPSSATPANPSENDANAVNLGVRFTADTSGFIRGIRFYKGSGNTGPHVARLWTASGTLLASASFGSETASGWQQADFASPVAISANTVYVASYLAPAGHYAADSGFFAAAGVDRAPLHLLQDGAGGGNGVYAYGASPAFPSSTWQSSNYWVDVVFSR